MDLAGSERLGTSNSAADRLKETQSINKSLSNLGNVIMALANGVRRSDMYMYFVGGESICLECRISRVQIPPEAATCTCTCTFSLKFSALGFMLCCVTVSPWCLYGTHTVPSAKRVHF